jgi:hypothetical protein
MRLLSRIPVAVAATLALGVALSGCAAGANGVYSSGGASADQAPQYVELGALEAADQAAADADQALVVTGTIVITTDDPLGGAARATELTLAAGGRVDSRSEFAPRGGDAGSAWLELRIPADALEEVRTQLAELGTVDETNFTSVDVGTQQRDLETRITTLRTSIARYTSWLADADKTADLIQLESAIAERQNELEMLEAQQRSLADQVAMSTVSLELRSTALAPPPEGPSNFWEGLVFGWHGFVGFWAAIVVALGVVLPWLVVLGVGLVVTLLLVRRSRRAKAAALVGAATPEAPTAPEATPTPEATAAFEAPAASESLTPTDD